MKSLKQNASIVRPIFIGSLVGAILAGTFVLGFYVRGLFPQVIQPPAAPLDQIGYPLVDEVQNLVDQIYLREQPDYITRQYAAVRGVLGSLEDPNTFFIDPPVARSEADVLAGTYGGIGVLVNRNELGEFVLYPFAESPASAAGIQSGSILIAVNGNPVTLETTIDSVDQSLRGEVIDDNGVELTIQQSGEEETIYVVFDVINVPSVIWRVTEDDRRIGYIQILRFTARTPEELQIGLSELNESNIQALVIDMRNNSGGLLNESIDVASEFIDRGIVIYEVTRNSERSFNAEQGGLATEIPLVVLVNNRTASAAELVAGAIRDNERGILIGQSTFGKGTVQQIFTLSDGSSVHITSAEWLTPNRTPIAGVGLVPDIEMIPDANGRDVEFGEAIRYIQQQLETE